MPIDDGIVPPDLPIHPADESPAEPDFFGGKIGTERWYFPGQDVQYIEFTLMNEGQRKKYQKKTSRGVKVNRKDQSAEIGIDPAGDRESLLLEVVVGWYILDRKNNNQPVAFSGTTSGSIFAQWMNRADPVIIDKLEFAVRTANPWMQDEMDSESIREEITRLEDLLKQAIDREAEKASFLT